MNKNSRHGEVKARIYKAILLDEMFTVSELCANTGLRADQVYPLLAKLRRDRYLLAECVPGTTRAAHRPNLVYKLTADAEKRRVLSDEIAPFLHLSQETLSQAPVLERAEHHMTILAERLEELAPRLESPEVQQLHALHEDTTRLQADVAVLKDDLEIAWYESKRSKSGTVPRRFAAELSKFQRLNNHVRDLNFRVESRIDEFKAEQEFSQLMHGVLAPEAPPGSALTIDRVFQGLNRVYKASDDFYLRKNLSSVAARITFLERRRSTSWIEVAYVLSEALIRFGSDPQLPIQLVSRIPDESIVTAYNLVNCRLLANDSLSAKELWNRVVAPESHWQHQELREALGSARHLSVFRSAILVTGDHASFSKQRLADLEDRTGLDGSFSIASSSPVEVFGTEAYAIKPTLVDWLEPNSSGFLVSATMRARLTPQKEILAYGPISDIVQFAGLPQVRLATALVRLGVDLETAWRVAETLKPGRVLLVLHTLNIADNSFLDDLKRILPETEFQYEPRVFVSGRQASYAA